MIALILPVGIEIFLELAAVEHVVTQDAGFLQWGDVLAHAVVELRVVAAGEELVYLFAELAELLLLFLDLGCLHLSAWRCWVEGGEAVGKTALPIGYIHALDAEEGVAAPGVDAHIEVDGGMTARWVAAGEVPDEWGRRKILEQVNFVAELLEKLFVEIFSQTLAAATLVHADQLDELGDLCTAVASLHQFLLNAHIQWLLAHSLAKWDDTVIVFCQDGTDDIGD